MVAPQSAHGGEHALGPNAPDRGDLVWLMFSPHAGHEQAGHRPALVLSPVAFNQKRGLALVCPITTQVKGFPFEVVLPDGLPIGGAVLVDQIKSVDWRARHMTHAGRAPDAIIVDVRAKLQTLL